MFAADSTADSNSVVCKESAIEEPAVVEHEVQCTNLVVPWKGVKKVQFQEYDTALRQKFGTAIMHTERIPNRILITAASTIVPELLADDGIDPAPQAPFASPCHHSLQGWFRCTNYRGSPPMDQHQAHLVLLAPQHSAQAAGWRCPLRRRLHRFKSNDQAMSRSP